MRKISAQYVIPGDGRILNRAIIEADNSGKILNIKDTGGKMPEESCLEFYNGVIVPGFVNTHSHIELSHLHGRIEKGHDLGFFVKNISWLGKETCHEDIIKAADREMYLNGIVACGDISNRTISAGVKKNSNIDYYTFVELYGSNPDAADSIMQKGMEVLACFHEYGLKAAISPHAPYSMSANLWNNIINNYKTGDNISIHLAESALENEMFLYGTGGLAGYAKKNGWTPPGTGSVEAMLPYLNNFERVISVHNTFISESDIEMMKYSRTGFYYVLCPGSNLFMGNPLPDINMLRKQGIKLCIGTDSLASNTTLSVLEEMKIIQSHIPDIDLCELISWASLNGAEALGMQDKIGSITPGKKPGLVLIENLDIHNKRLLKSSTLKILL